jgi:hypothetical protein
VIPMGAPKYEYARFTTGGSPDPSKAPAQVRRGSANRDWRERYFRRPESCATGKASGNGRHVVDCCMRRAVQWPVWGSKVTSTAGDWSNTLQPVEACSVGV